MWHLSNCCSWGSGMKLRWRQFPSPTFGRSCWFWFAFGAKCVGDSGPGVGKIRTPFLWFSGQEVAWLWGTRGDTSSCQQQVLVVRSPSITFLWVLKYKIWVLLIFNISTNMSCSITAWTDAGLWPALLVVLQGSLPFLTSLLPGSTWQDQALSGAWHWYIPLWILRFLHYNPQQLVEGLTFIMLFSIHANSCLTSAGSILFLNQETYLIKVTGGLAQQRQVCCLWHKKPP